MAAKIVQNEICGMTTRRFHVEGDWDEVINLLNEKLGEDFLCDSCGDGDVLGIPVKVTQGHGDFVFTLKTGALMAERFSQAIIAFENAFA